MLPGAAPMLPGAAPMLPGAAPMLPGAAPMLPGVLPSHDREGETACLGPDSPHDHATARLDLAGGAGGRDEATLTRRSLGTLEHARFAVVLTTAFRARRSPGASSRPPARGKIAISVHRLRGHSESVHGNADHGRYEQHVGARRSPHTPRLPISFRDREGQTACFRSDSPHDHGEARRRRLRKPDGGRLRQRRRAATEARRRAATARRRAARRTRSAPCRSPSRDVDGSSCRASTS
jgi:hypothetical protein